MTKSERSPGRTREEIAHDVAVVLKAELHDKTKRAVVKNAAWAWTTMSGKYDGCRYWTQAARDHFNAATAKRKAKGLIHEHVVPIEALFQFLIALPEPTEDAVYDCLEKCLHGVVVTKSEHDRLNREFKHSMPQGFDYRTDQIRARYERCEIEIIEPSVDEQL
ncbi:MAG TPA: hypothetical protein VEQ85_08600 [Lacipirellulaceae bacterium]|nr:hypothetical protein [Lacipirellulaceae bacterium]